MKRLTILSLIVLSMVFFNFNLQAGDKVEVNKTFKPKETVRIKTVSGDCIVKKGKSSEIKVHLVYTFPKDKFKPVFEEEGNALILKEEFSKEGNCKGVSGSSTWTVTVPEKTDIAFSSASGDFSAAGLSSEVQAKAASGDIHVEGLKGKLEAKVASGDITVKKSGAEVLVKTASGDIKIMDSKGQFKLHCASGDIEASGVVIKGECDFESVSGDVAVTLAKTSEYDLNLNTVSGDVTLDYNGNPVKGYFEFKGKKKHIHSDIPFDNEDTSKYNPFAKRYFKKGGDSPEVFLKTISGKLEFKK